MLCDEVNAVRKKCQYILPLGIVEIEPGFELVAHLVLPSNGRLFCSVPSEDYRWLDRIGRYRWRGEENRGKDRGCDVTR